MDPQHRKQQGLGELRPVVASLHVRMLVKNHLIELVDSQRFDERRWNGDARSVESQYRRTRHLVADHQRGTAAARLRFDPEWKPRLDVRRKRTTAVAYRVHGAKAWQHPQQTHKRDGCPDANEDVDKEVGR